MNAAEKKAFIETICDRVRDEIIEKIPKMPEEWNGFQLRELVGEMFQREKMNMSRRQRRDYHNDCYMYNL